MFYHRPDILLRDLPGEDGDILWCGISVRMRDDVYPRSGRVQALSRGMGSWLAALRRRSSQDPVVGAHQPNTTLACE